MNTVHIYGKVPLNSKSSLNKVALSSREIAGLKEIKFPIPPQPRFREVLVRVVKVADDAKIDQNWMRQIEPRGIRYEILKSY